MERSLTKSRLALLLLLGMLLMLSPLACKTKTRARNRVDEKGLPHVILWAWERPEDLEFLDPQRFGKECQRTVVIAAIQNRLGQIMQRLSISRVIFAQRAPPDLDRLAPIIEAAMSRMPALHEAGLKRVVNGPITYTPDGNPLLGPAPGGRNLWLACGFSFGDRSRTQ